MVRAADASISPMHASCMGFPCVAAFLSLLLTYSLNRELSSETITSYVPCSMLMMMNVDLDACRQQIEYVRFAKVPVLKLEHANGVKVDLCFNNLNGVRNTALLRTYVHCDPRVRQLILAVKAWAKAHGLNEAGNGFFSSYSHTLLVIFFLQVRALCIHQAAPSHLTAHVAVHAMPHDLVC